MFSEKSSRPIGRSKTAKNDDVKRLKERVEEVERNLVTDALAFINNKENKELESQIYGKAKLKAILEGAKDDIVFLILSLPLLISILIILLDFRLSILMESLLIFFFAIILAILLTIIVIPNVMALIYSREPYLSGDYLFFVRVLDSINFEAERKRGEEVQESTIPFLSEFSGSKYKNITANLYLRVKTIAMDDFFEASQQGNTKKLKEILGPIIRDICNDAVMTYKKHLEQKK